MRPSPFTVNVAAVGLAPGARRRVQRSGAIAGLAVTGSAVDDDAEVEVDVVLEAVPGAVIARGMVRSSWHGACRRCLTEVSGELGCEVVEVFDKHPEPEQTYPLQGDHLDLEPLARDAVVLGLPLAPLCREECRGLCPSCGANLNEGDCACEPGLNDPRWAALDALRDR